MKVKHLNENQDKFLDSTATDAAAVAEFSKKEPKYESMNDIPAGWKKDEKTLNRYTYWDNDFFASASVSNSMQDPRNVMTIIQILDKRNPDNSKEIIKHVRVEDVKIDFDKVLFDTVRRANVLLSQLRETTRMKHVTEDYLDSAEFRIQRYEDDIPELFHRVHDGYMNGMVNAKAYADVLAKIYSVLEELDYVDDSLKESYMDTHEGVANVDTLDLMAALKSVVREHGHMELVTPIRCEIKNDDHGRRLALIPTTNEGLVENSKVKNGKFAGTTNEAFDMSHSPDLSNLCWQVASHLDADALGEDKWIEFICDDPRDTTGGKKSIRFEAIGEDEHMYGFIRTTGDAVDVHFRNGSEAICHSVEEIARFIAGEFGISI